MKTHGHGKAHVLGGSWATKELDATAACLQGYATALKKRKRWNDLHSNNTARLIARASKR